MYSDFVCRLCGEGDETIEHVLTYCQKVNKEPLLENTNVYTEDKEMQRAISHRAKQFADQVLEKEMEEHGL